MAKLWQALKRLVSRDDGPALGPEQEEELRAAFRARYHNFKLLLAANNKALEIMGEMEATLRGGRPFGMRFVRANCTAVGVNVFNMVKNMDALAPGRYTALYERFHQINDSINLILAEQRVLKGDKCVLTLAEVDRHLTDQVGAKMANLGEVKNRVGLRVPEGFVITALGYQRFFAHNDLQAEIDRRIQAATFDRMDQLFALSSAVQQLIIKAEVPKDLAEAIETAHRDLQARTRPGVTVSMRSSALGEDDAGLSFAGQYQSQLNVTAEHLLQSYKEIVASKYSLQAVFYRLGRGVRDEDVAMCVGCMAMVDAVAGGVIYTRNAVDIRDESVHINSVWGLPKSVVDGATPVDLFVVERSDPPRIRERVIARKDRKFVCYPGEGVCRLDLTGETADAPSLDDGQILELTRIALTLEEYYGGPQDIEWAIAPDGSVLVLQCRPLMQKAAPDGRAGRATAGGRVLISGGVTASPGVAAGPVHWVRKDHDALDFPEGGVLVCEQARPRWAALLSRAAAVVAAEGGVAGHLANVAREFEVPALFGSPGLAALANGQEVTVDADGLAIYAERVAALLERAGKRRNLMEGSPVHQTLARVLNHISPLTLLNPDAPEFRAANVQTLHDITRFCHEKAVHEMFAFGKEHHFSERSSKQLYYKVPMQWWVINLDDGFKEDVKGKYVGLDLIASVPMLALWEGMIAVPWEGPPPVDAKGFAAVMFQATTNPALVSALKSSYANRNYFMISKHFCSLYSRFGFHFSTVEALVGERPSENYIAFSFKGGAADMGRRLLRAQLVAEVLEEQGFRVERKEDATFARIEGLDEARMVEKCRVLGYLSMHTRQLDMVMADPAAAAHFGQKIRRDLAAMCSQGQCQWATAEAQRQAAETPEPAGG
ncbi:MAG: PEP/pyruvate-binding domain-containing protein [Thermodesulfobacteriota bacterium]